jgi:hypothetical protein
MGQPRASGRKAGFLSSKSQKGVTSIFATRGLSQWPVRVITGRQRMSATAAPFLNTGRRRARNRPSGASLLVFVYVTMVIPHRL